MTVARRAAHAAAAMHRITGCLAALLSLVAVSATGQPRTACDGDLCRLDDGGYRAVLPDTTSPSLGAFVYLHGYGSSSADALRNADMVRRVTNEAFAFIAVDGQPNPRQPGRLDWNVVDGTEMPRDDIDFVARVIADATARFGLDPDMIVLAGYSRGGSMVWDIACTRPDLAQAFASYAGGFWEPMAETCAGGVHLFHSHGVDDGTVPMAGRRLTWNGHSFEQGDIFKGLDVFRSSMGCSDASVPVRDASALRMTWWRDCEDGSVLLAENPGGHGRIAPWPSLVLEWSAMVRPY